MLNKQNMTIKHQSEIESIKETHRVNTKEFKDSYETKLREQREQFLQMMNGLMKKWSKKCSLKLVCQNGSLSQTTALRLEMRCIN